MKIKSIISLLFILVISILYFFGFCEWDLPVYILCVVVTLVFMLISIKQEKKYQRLMEKQEVLDRELKRNALNS